MSTQVTLPLCFQQAGILCLQITEKTANVSKKEARFPAGTHSYNIYIVATVHNALWNINLSLRNQLFLMNNHIKWENFISVSTGS